MKAFLAAWKDLQDTIVRHPFCRYTILPAGIVLAIWLVAVPTMAWNWWQEGYACTLTVDLTDEYVVRLDDMNVFFSFLASIGLVGLVLTGRWLPILVALVYMFFPFIIYHRSEMPENSRLLISALCLAPLVPIVVWTQILDRRRKTIPKDSPPDSRPQGRPLTPRMRKLAWTAAGFCLLQIPALLSLKNGWLQNGMLQALLAGFLFTAIVDILWRLSPGLVRGLLGGLAVGFYIFIFIDIILMDFFYHRDPSAIEFVLGLLAGIVGYILASRPGRDDAPRQK